MKNTRAVSLTSVLLTLAVCSAISGQRAAPKIAFTFDDLRAHSALPPGETWLEVAFKIISALREARVPATYGFVNGVQLEEHPGDAAVLGAWRAAGNPLGNHTWSQMNLNEHSVDGFEKDTIRNEEILSVKMANQDRHWFRFPFLAEGDTREKKEAIHKFLKRRSLTETLYGRDLSYVLLMHIGAFDAEMLPQLLSLYQKKGFKFVSLPEAERDPFYREDVDLSLAAGPDSLEVVTVERHLPLPSNPPLAPPGDLCR